MRTASRPWTSWSQSTLLDLAKDAHEKTILDLKQTYDLAKPTELYELAKDLAAFANALGGTLLVGASERSDSLGRKTGRIEGFVPVPDPAALIKAATSAAKDLCRPSLVVEPEVITLTPDEQRTVIDNPVATDTTLVAFNVTALIASPTGVGACDGAGKRIPDAYRFPVRVIEGTKWLTPEELAFYMNSHERRIYLQLQDLPRDQMIQVWDKGQGDLGAKRGGHLRDLDAARTIAKFEMGGQMKRIVHIPLTFVNAVWLDESDVWNVDVKGAINTSQHSGAVCSVARRTYAATAT